MRIAQVAPLYESVPPRLYGGTERVVSWLTEELVRMGHEVTLFASGDSKTSAYLISAASQALRLNDQIVEEMPYFMIQLEQVKQHAREFDFIHWHIDYMSYPLSHCIPTPQVTTLHGRLDLPDLFPLYKEFQDIPVISISDAQRTPLPWINWQGTVHHGLPANLFTPHNARGEYLAVLGRISPEKGVDRAIEIAKRVGMPLRIAAKISKPDRPYYEQVIKPLLDHPLIEFVGEINEKQKDDFLGNAYAVLFPINWPEPFGIVMIEAMACGTPIVAFPGGSVEEVEEDGVTGYLVTNVEEAVRAVERVPELSRRRVRAAFEERFTAAQMTRNYLALYHRIIETQTVARARHFATSAGNGHGSSGESAHTHRPSSSGVHAPSTRSDLQNEV
jgi:glycosyltransferase involved in cell wall biosynthesis